MHWQQVLPDLFLFPDSCNVYAVIGPAGALIVDAGTGLWLDHIDELPKKPVALLCTHYFRDHSEGALRASEQGIPVYVPEGELKIFSDPLKHFRQRETYIIYDNLWDLYAPIEAVGNVKPMPDYGRMELAGLEVEVVPLPGVTMTQSGYAITLPGNSAPVIFCGEAIHSPGRIARIAPLQYNYNDLLGAANCHYAAQMLRNHKPAALLPSLGEPILRDTDAALEQLQQNLRTLVKDRPDVAPLIQCQSTDSLKKVTDNLWHSTHTESWNWFVKSKSGKVLVIDYGYNLHVTSMPAYSLPARRRALLHSLEGIKRHLGADRIDTVLVSHFHDDHVCGIPVLQRLFGTQCWAGENFADLLENPDAHCFPCTWPVPCKVDRRLALDEPFQWEEYTFHLHPMSGHTRFATLIGFEVDGKRIAHTGDQYFFQPMEAQGRDDTIKQNHVYRNGALLDGYDLSGKWLLDWRPDIVISGHAAPWNTDDKFFDLIQSWTKEYRSLHQDAMVLGAEEAHFNLDSWGGWIWPYRTHLDKPAKTTFKVTVRNPLPKRAKLDVALVGPRGWVGSSTSIEADPRAEVTCRLHITPSGPCRRQPFAVSLCADGKPFGQVTEALMTVGGERF